MLNSKSVKTRFALSIVSNAGRAAISFFSGLLVARALSPAGYGDLTFLLGSFAAIRTLLDMGSSSAFYTFISQRSRCRRFFLFYFGWLVLQFVVVLCLVAVVMPQAVVAKVWLEHSRSVIILAFAAAFMQYQVWTVVAQIGEASRKTVRVQTMNMTVGLTHFALIAFLYFYKSLSVELIFALIVVEYIVAIFWAWRFLDNGAATVVDGPADLTFAEIFREYVKYCKPLALLSWIGFLYNFADNWMLQRFGGAKEQGFYQIAYQFSAVSLVATTSILNVLWKEVAEAHGRGDTERVSFLYRRVNQGLLIFGAILSGLLIPWSEEISAVFLGRAYAMAAPVMFIMFFFPIHQSMGQVGGTMLLASGKTYTYLIISGAFMLLSLPISYMVQAPASDALMPGLGLGAVGMAVKMVLLNIVSVNVMAWAVARHNKLKYEWLYQVVGIGGVVAIGFVSKTVAGAFWDVSVDMDKVRLVLPFFVSAVVYLPMVSVLIWAMPWLVGMERREIKNAVNKVKKFKF